MVQEKHKWHVFVTEGWDLAQKRPENPAFTQVHRTERRFGLRDLCTVSTRYRRAVPLCTTVHCFLRLTQDSGPLERSSELNFSAMMQQSTQ